MTIWLPDVNRSDCSLYRGIADALARDVESGRLSPGDRLPPQRELANAIGVTVATVTRAYGEAARRGLVEATVGRGTFVCPIPGSTRLGEPVDLSLNAIPPHPFLGELGARLDRGLTPGRRVDLLGYPPRGGLPAQREVASGWLRRRGVTVPAERVLLTSGAQHALLVALAATRHAGGPLLVEALTFGGAVGAARLLGLAACPVPVDAEGLDVEALERVSSQSGGRVLYVQPTIHNPTGVSMSPARRARLIEVASRLRLTVVEDDVYGFLAPETPPLVASLAERWCLVTSLSKSLSGGYRVGYLGVSADLVADASAALWASAIAASSVSAAHATSLVEDGTAARVAEWKRTELVARQRIAREVFGDVPEAIHPASPHLWLPLPRPWRPAAFAAEARARGVALGPTEGFLGQPGAVPRAVRICLGPPPTRDALRAALETLAALALAPPAPAPVV